MLFQVLNIQVHLPLMANFQGFEIQLKTRLTRPSRKVGKLRKVSEFAMNKLFYTPSNVKHAVLLKCNTVSIGKIISMWNH